MIIYTFLHHYVYYICNLDYVQYLYSCMYFIERYENKLKFKLKLKFDPLQSAYRPHHTPLLWQNEASDKSDIKRVVLL